MVRDAEEGVAAHQGEGHCLHGGGGDTRRVDGLDGDPDPFLERREQCRVPRAAAAHQDASGAHAVEMVARGSCDGLGRERDEAGEEVGKLASRCAPAMYQLLGLCDAVALAPGRLGRRLREELVVEELGEQSFVHLATGCQRTVGIEASASVGPGRHGAIEQ